MTVKVRCFPIRSQSLPDWRPEWRPVDATSALPFVYSRNGRYTHRVRAVTSYPHRPDRNGLAVHAWCGQMLHTSGHSPARMGVEAHPDRPLCGTCHGRAVGAGQVDTDGVPLIFTPRSGTPNLGLCIWQKPGWGPYGYPSRCYRTAVERVPEAREGEKAGVCGEHARKWPPSVLWRYEASLNHGGLTLGPRGQAALGGPPDTGPRFEGDPQLDAFDEHSAQDEPDTFDDLVVPFVDDPFDAIPRKDR